jgi:hypothetical protein
LHNFDTVAVTSISELEDCELCAVFATSSKNTKI